MLKLRRFAKQVENNIHQGIKFANYNGRGMEGGGGTALFHGVTQCL
jgi:hypothetical protein